MVDCPSPNFYLPRYKQSSSKQEYNSSFGCSIKQLKKRDRSIILVYLGLLYLISLHLGKTHILKQPRTIVEVLFIYYTMSNSVSRT